MDEETLILAAFAKMVRGEPMSLNDTRRVFQVILQNPPRIDSANNEEVQQFLSEAKMGLERVYLKGQ